MGGSEANSSFPAVLRILNFVKHRAMIAVDKKLVFEEMDGKPILYKGYHRALMGEFTAESIMGSSISQSFVVSVILEFLYSSIDKKKYQILTSELGLHLGKGDNLSADIAIYDKQKQVLDLHSEKYASVPPKVVIEVDLKADVSDFASPLDYYLLKTSKLLGFGVEKVIWVSTQSQTVMVAGAGEEMKPQPWDTTIQLLPQLSLSIGELVKEAEKA
jgi:Uma2 family endonuclease